MGQLACKTKIVIDGDNGANLLLALCERVEAMTPDEVAMLTDEKAYPLIKKLIKIEKLATECQDDFLTIIGYDGPRPEWFPPR